MDSINFRDISYPIRIIDFPDVGECQISITKLNRALISDEGDFVSENARIIDENIFYFIDEKDINLHSTELKNKILSEII